MEELKLAGRQLRIALDHYLDVCSVIRGLCLHESAQDVPKKYLRDINIEMSYFPMYETKVKEANILMAQAHNQMFQFSPINSLPAEIMTHIFHLLTASQTCNLDLLARAGERLEMATSISDDFPRIERFPIYPDYLAQICSYWRQIAISSPSLWSHIDFIPQKRLHKRMLARAKAYAERTKPIPVTLHIHEDRGAEYEKEGLEDFLISVACRTKSIDFTSIGSGNGFTRLVLTTLLRGSSSGATELTQLRGIFIGASHALQPHFVPNNHNLSTYGSLALDLPGSVIGDSLSNVSILHLRGLFPSWTSAAYHNLVDLRLSASSKHYWPGIPESKFQDVLKASPRLRILHFALDIISRQRRDSFMKPVHLADLEVLNIATPPPVNRDSPSTSEPGDILRLLSPGSKPLQLSVWHYGGQQCTSSAKEFKNFFQRSNITKFHTKGMYPPFDEFLSYAPNLQVLGLDPNEFEFHPPKRSMSRKSKRASVTPKLSSLILVDWDYCKMDELDVFLQYHPAETIVFINYTMSSQSDQVEIWKNHPNVQVFSYHPGYRTSDSLDDWDIFSIDFHGIIHSHD